MLFSIFYQFIKKVFLLSGLVLRTLKCHSMRNSLEKKILIIILFFFFAKLLIANDTTKLNRIKIYADAWGLIAFYHQFDESEAIEYFQLLSKELEIMDNSSQSVVLFNKSLEKIINFAIEKGNIIIDSSIVEAKYKLICDDLFDWIDCEYIDTEKQLYFRRIALYGVVQPNSEYTLIPPILITSESTNNKEYASLLTKIEINNKFDVLGMYIYIFNVYNYLSNYPIDDCNNESIFYFFADKILKLEDSNIKQIYSWIMMQIMSSQKDSHLMTKFNYWPTPLNKYIQMAIKDSSVIITNVAKNFGIHHNIKIGDIIHSVENVPIQIRNTYYKSLLEGSNASVTNARLANKTLTFNTNDSLVFFSTIRNEEVFNHTINLNAIESQPLPTDYFPDKFKIINDSITYINLGKCNDDEFVKYLKTSKKMTKIIIDCRVYPRNINLSNKLGKYIISFEKVFRYMLVPCENKPGYNDFDSTNISTVIYTSKSQKNKAKKFKSNKKFYFISSEKTISRGEFYLSFLSEVTNGTIVGRNTAGVPSHLRFFRLPLNVNIDMSLMKVYDCNMNLISGKGIVPDIYVEEDIINYEQILNIIKTNIND